MRKNGALSCILLMLGAGALLSLLPSWIWLMLLGIMLIVLAVALLRCCR